MTTKIIWPLDTPDEITLTENPDGSRSASYVDSKGHAKTVVIKPNGSRIQTVDRGNGKWKILYEFSVDGVLLVQTKFTDGTVWSVWMHPGAVNHVIAYDFPNSTGTHTTYYANGLQKVVNTGADGRVTTTITNDDGIQHISN